MIIVHTCPAWLMFDGVKNVAITSPLPPPSLPRPLLRPRSPLPLLSPRGTKNSFTEVVYGAGQLAGTSTMYRVEF